MKINKDDSDKLVFNKQDVYHLYCYLRDTMVVPKYGMPIEHTQFVLKLWDALSIISTPNDFQETKRDLKGL